MYRAIFTDGDLECTTYEHSEYGIDIYDEEDTHLAFIPYASLDVLLNEEADTGVEPSIAD
jgi:hypothetical protein